MCFLLVCYSELWRKESTLQQTLSSLKEDLAKADQSLRSMAGKVGFQYSI
jgi:structural maintenance of chromosome 3 (chondroitin sulfate proteoglycan 6)